MDQQGLAYLANPTFSWRLGSPQLTETLIRCQQRNMTLMGWIRKDDNPNSAAWEAVINPEDKETKLRWNAKEMPYGDLLIVLSLD